MGRKKRLDLISQLEEKTNTAVICYITGDRENLSTRIAPDIIRVFYRHLEAIGKRERISLFLYTRGGDVLTPWRLVSLLREYCRYLIVLVPFRCYSAGTLTCLGADEIVMTRMGELSPIDPSVANVFNPKDPHHQTARIPVSVEDVISYFSLAREKAGLNHEEQLAEVFLRLSKVVHPLSLGNVHRNYLLIRSLARKLLELHIAPPKPEEAEYIIKNLSEELHAHNYMIPRREARDRIGLRVTEPSPEVEALMWGLYERYENNLKLLSPFNPAALLSDQEPQIDFEATGGIIESAKKLDTFTFEGRVARQPQAGPGMPPVCLEITRQYWKAVE